MAWLFGFMGAIAGLICAAAIEAEGLGFFMGAVVGALLGSWINLRSRVGSLEQKVADLHRRLLAVSQWAAHPQAEKEVAPKPTAPVAPTPVPAPSREPAHPATAPTTWAAVDDRGVPIDPTPISLAQLAAEAASEAAATLPAETPNQAPSRARAPLLTRRGETPPPLDFADTPAQASAPAAAQSRPQAPPPRPREPVAPATGFGADAWRWLIEGNWVAKVGIVLVLIALGAFFRFASKQGWLTFPIELRLAGVAAGAIAALWLGWRERVRRRVFALNLQGGAIAVLQLTVFAAYHMYHLLQPAMAFALLFLLVFSGTILAITQRSLGLAVFALIGGFAAPILVSTGSGNHVALFSYYLVLNTGILAVSWYRGWRVLNVLGFVFTFVIGSLWGDDSYRPELFNTTEPFLIAFFLLYLAIPLLPALRNQDPDRRDIVDGTLVFGTPLVAFGLQTALLSPNRDQLALSALVMAIIYAALSVFVWRHAQLARWRKAYAGLSLVFATLVIPLAFSARTTAAFWAIEGAAMVWLGLSQDQRRLRWVGLLLQFMAGISLLVGGALPSDAPLILNRITMTGLMIALAGVFSATMYQRRSSGNVLSPMLVLWSATWWFGLGFMEIDRMLIWDHRPDVLIGFLAVSGLIFALARRGLKVPSLGWPTMFILATAVIWVMVSTARHSAPFSETGLYTMSAYFLIGLLSLWTLRSPWPLGLGWVHTFWWLAVPVAILLQINHAFDVSPALQGLGEAWRLAALGLPVLGLTALLLREADWLGMPLHESFPSYRIRPTVFMVVVVILGFFLFAFSSGDAKPLPFVPLFNPIELMQWFAILVLWRWFNLQTDTADARYAAKTVMTALIFGQITLMTLRATHQYGGEAWSLSMLTHSLPNAALSIVWTVLGIAGMLIGSSRGRRAMWIAGAVVLGVVVAKLLLLDMRLLGTLPSIISLLTVGILFVAVGYFAPMPPSSIPLVASDDGDDESESDQEGAPR
ncbi:DUF2339 domain-containing protein [Ahniella affigens]|uniref:DUF2339 domain-containing protein n=1 Tax=Ahniella affigens TaxID=2021234 RepID=A0A2P1PU53_9GAMM|nr:DUF2339 domain-containing protein [Ahniella affigens]AVP98361.1 DUF2339 domain-containing protein [Ahniella affigens]